MRLCSRRSRCSRLCPAGGACRNAAGLVARAARRQSTRPPDRPPAQRPPGRRPSPPVSPPRLGQKSDHVQIVGLLAGHRGWRRWRFSSACGPPPAARPAKTAGQYVDHAAQAGKTGACLLSLGAHHHHGTVARATFPEMARHTSSRSGRAGVVQEQEVGRVLGCCQNAKLAAVRGRHTEARLASVISTSFRMVGLSSTTRIFSSGIDIWFPLGNYQLPRWTRRTKAWWLPR